MNWKQTISWVELVVIPVGLVLGWLASGVFFPSEATDAAERGAPPRISESHSRVLPLSAGPVDPGLLVDLDTVDACRRALEDLDSLEGLHPLVVSALRDRALRAWLDLDSADALAHAEGNVKHFFGKSFGEDLFRVWIDLDVESAVEAFSVASPALVSSTYQAFFTEVGHHDPERALDMLAEPRWHPESLPWFRRDEVIREVYTVMARRDPRAALARCRIDLQNRASTRLGGSGLPVILKTWAEVDPSGAWEYIKNHEDEFGVDSIASYLLSDHPEIIEDVKERIASSMSGSAGDIEELVAYNLGAMARTLAERDLTGALRFAESRPEGDLLRREILAKAARMIATADPERALQLYAESGGSVSDFVNDGIFREAFLTLNTREPESAQALLAEVPESKRAVALSGMLTHEFATGHQAAISRCREFLNNPETKDLVVPALTEALSRGHGSGNHDLSLVVEALPEFRSEVRGYVLEGWVRVAPEAAAAFIAEEATRLAEAGKDFNHGNRAFGDVTERAISELAVSRPEFVSEWVFTLPEEALRDQVAQSLAANWVRFDRQSAETWVEGLPEGTMKEKAARMLTASTEERGPFR